MTPHQLVITNFNVLEQANRLANEIDDTVMSEIGKSVEQWASNRGWWVAQQFKNDYLDCRFSPQSWPSDPETQERKAYYQLGDTSMDYLYYMSSLTGAVQIEYGIWLRADARFIFREARPRATWQRFLADQIRDRRLLEASQFRLVGGDLFLPLRLSKDDLADAYPNALNQALGPLDDALGALMNAHPAIDQIVMAAAARLKPPRRRARARSS